MSDVVLDSSAVLALLLGEPGADIVQATLPGALLSTVNLGEVVSKLVERGMPAQEASDAIMAIGIEPVAFSTEQAVFAGELRPSTKALGLSLGDRACLALAQTRGLPALTADAVWKQLSQFEIVLIRAAGD